MKVPRRTAMEHVECRLNPVFEAGAGQHYHLVSVSVCCWAATDEMVVVAQRNGHLFHFGQRGNGHATLVGRHRDAKLDDGICSLAQLRNHFYRAFHIQLGKGSWLVGTIDAVMVEDRRPRCPSGDALLNRLLDLIWP